MVCRAAVGKEWGLIPPRLQWIYNQVIRPKITYGASVWAYRLTERDKKLLNSLQRLSMMQMTSAMRSTPTFGLEATLGIPH